MTDRLIQISLKIPEGLLTRLDKFSKEHHHSRTDILLMGCEEHMDRVENPEKFLTLDQEETTRAIMFRMTREDEEYRKEIRHVLGESLIKESGKNSSRNRD